MKEFINIVGEGSSYKYEKEKIIFDNGKEFSAQHYGLLVGNTLIIDDKMIDECDVIELFGHILELHSHVYLDTDKKVFGVDAELELELEL